MTSPNPATDTDPSAWNAERCAAVEALRIGVSNRYVAKYVSYGRRNQIREIESSIRDSDRGSCQIVVGGYGMGKSHICEIVANRLLDSGYAVAKLEMGASSGRAENPHAVLASIGRSLSVRIDGQIVRGNTDLALLLRASQPVKESWRWDYEIRNNLMKKYPGETGVIQRLGELRQAYREEARESRYLRRLPTLLDDIPSTMTAANLAVAEVNKAAHVLRPLGIKGVVLLFDEAERSNWAYSNYRTDRALTLMTGFACAAANKKTDRLKHYRNETYYRYVPKSPSRIHAVYWFTHEWGVARSLKTRIRLNPINLPDLDPRIKRRIRKGIEELYSAAYSCEVNLSKWAERTIEKGDSEDIRRFVRRTVAALDYMRLNSHNH